MGRCRCLFLLLIVFTVASCKKTELVDPEISIQDVYIEMVRSNQVDMNYKLSHLGYQETGIIYHKKSDPATTAKVKAIRKDGVLRLSMQRLDVNTEYVFKVFFTQNNEQKTDTKEHLVKTLSAEMAKFALEVKNTPINYDDDGNFAADIEGDYLNNLNLSKLEIKVNLKPVAIGYPVAISGNRFKIRISGKVNPVDGSYAVAAMYEGKEILFQSVPFAFNGDRYWLNHKATNLRGYYVSVFDDELYYFVNKKVEKWNATEQRLLTVGVVPDYTIKEQSVGTQFDGRLFFPAVEKTTWPNQQDLSDNYNQPEAYSYIPGTTVWDAYPFPEQIYPQRSRMIQNSNYFIHKGELFLTYSIVDNSAGNPSKPRRTDNFIHRYNKATKQFGPGTGIGTEIIEYHYISVNNQLYLLGRVPVVDQGFKLGATFAIFKVTDNFSLEEIYRGGTVAAPLEIIPKYVTVYDQKILIAHSLADFFLFDPSSRQLSRVYFKSNLPQMYLGGFFNYNNKLHLNADLHFTSQKVYEISVSRGR